MAGVWARFPALSESCHKSASYQRIFTHLKHSGYEKNQVQNALVTPGGRGSHADVRGLHGGRPGYPTCCRDTTNAPTTTHTIPVPATSTR